jgi:STE24 endopeptidase
LLFLCLTFVSPSAVARAESGAPGPSYVDRRVSAIPASDLLTRAPSELVDARRQESAHRLRVRTRPLWLFWAFSQVTALILLWRRGAAAKLRDALSGLPSVHAIRFAFAFVMTFIISLVALPAAFVIFRLGVAFGVVNGRSGEWLRDVAVATTLEALLAGSFVVAVFWLVDRTRLWYVLAAAGVVAFALVTSALEPALVMPLFNRTVPLAAGDPSTPRLLDLEARAGIPQTPLVVADLSRRTPVVAARALGYGPTSRIVIGDTLLHAATPGEVAFVATREFVHSARGDVWRGTLFRALFVVICAALAVLISDRVGFRRDDDPLARLALSFGLLGAILLLAAPVANAYSRGVEARADREAIALTGDPVAAARTFVRIADEQLAPLCPPRIVRLYLYDRPPLGSRIAAAMGRPDPCP